MKTFEELLRRIKKDCKKNKVRCLFTNTNPSNGLDCSGYFHPGEKPIIAANINKKDVVLHEYCHMQQWKNKTHLWQKSIISSTYLFDWINGKKCPNIKKHIDTVRLMELEAEKMAVELMDEYDIGISKQEYIRNANNYQMFFNWLKISRKWLYTETEESISHMSSKFDMDYNTISPELIKIFNKRKSEH